MESALIITVMYDPKIEVVDYVYSVEVRDEFTGRTTDISRIWEDFEDELNAIVDKIDWSQQFAEYASDPDNHMGLIRNTLGL